MRFEDLEVFRAVHETGGFQRAAARCGLSQSAVTKVVRKLEEEFGLQLIERRTRSHTLTPAGRRLYQRAVEAGELTASTRRDMAAEASSLRGAIRFGVVPALLGTIVAPVIAELMATPGSAQVLISVKHSAELVRMLEDGKLDLVLCSAVQHLPLDVVRSKVGQQRYRLVVRAGHALAGTVPTLAQLASQRWLLPTNDVTLRTDVERMFSEAGLGPLDVRVETDTSATLLIPLLRRSDLVTALPAQNLQPSAQNGLTELGVDLDGLTGELAIYHRRTAPSIGLAMDLKQRLTAQALHNSKQPALHSRRESI